MITSAARSIWDEPRAADPPSQTWRDGVWVGVAMAAALLEGVFRDGVTWRVVVTIVAVALAPLLLWRRSHPLLCVTVGFGTSVALGVVGLLVGEASVGLDAMVYLLVLVYALVRWGSGRQIVIGLTVVGLAAASSIATTPAGPVELLGGIAVLVATVAGGAALRFRAESWRRSLEQVRSQERVSLARELHDSVAHHISAITVQAQAGQTLAASRPAAALEALAVIEGEASRTLAEMRAMVRVLREDGPAQYGPQPGIDELGSLARRTPDLVVEVDVAGDLTRLPSQLDAAVYRIAQEALTNVRRHARNVSRAQISVTEQDGWLRLRVIDDGEVDPLRPTARGFGLLGMNERAQLLGGTLQAGPMPTGGWEVDARLPIGAKQ